MLDVGCWMFSSHPVPHPAPPSLRPFPAASLDVGCWMLDVGCFPPIQFLALRLLRSGNSPPRLTCPSRRNLSPPSTTSGSRSSSSTWPRTGAPRPTPSATTARRCGNSIAGTRQERQQPPAWEQLQRDDFRAYLRFLGRHNLSRAAIQLRFSALRTFYRFLIRHGAGGRFAHQEPCPAQARQAAAQIPDAGADGRPARRAAQAPARAGRDGLRRARRPPLPAGATWPCWRPFTPAACASASFAAWWPRTLTGTNASSACAAKARRNA